MSTLVVYSDTTDGYIYGVDGMDDEFDGYDGSYASARATPTGADAAAVFWAVGQVTYGSFFVIYNVYESFLSFDTSSIGGSGTVSAAVLNLTSYADNSTTDFTIEARLRDWGASLTTADWVTSLSALTLLAHRDTSSGWTPATAYDLTDDAFAANVSKTGSTRLLLCSDHTTANTAPTGYESVSSYSADYTGTTRDPKLTVTYAAGGGTLFLMLEDNSGSYELEDGSGGTKLEN